MKPHNGLLSSGRTLASPSAKRNAPANRGAMTSCPLKSMYPLVPDLHGGETFGEIEGFVEPRRNDHPTVGIHVAIFVFNVNQKRQSEMHVLARKSSGEGQENPNSDGTNFAFHGSHPVRFRHRCTLV